MPMPAGYSGTPLIRKLGLKSGMRVRLLDAPEHYLQLLGDLPDDITLLKTTRGKIDFIQLFAHDLTTLRKRLPGAVRALDRDGMLWISWPKKSGSLATDVDDAAVRAAGLDSGLVDIKVCAVDADWSGLKFVYRREDR